jgi:hypothetical protein
MFTNFSDTKMNNLSIKQLVKFNSLIEQLPDNFPIVTNEQIRTKNFPDSFYSHNKLLKVLFPTVRDPGGVYLQQLDTLREIGIIVRFPDKFDDKTSRFFLNKEQFEKKKKLLEKRNKSQERADKKVVESYFNI